VPTSIKRRGALRSYDMYTKWGYFERRMSLRHREQRSQSTLLTLGLNQGARSNPDPPSAAPWKFFENVPDELSSLRTTEAIAVAERHLRWSHTIAFHPHEFKQSSRSHLIISALWRTVRCTSCICGTSPPCSITPPCRVMCGV